MNNAQYLNLVAESGLAVCRLRPEVCEQMLIETCRMLLDVLWEGKEYPPDSLLLSQCADYDILNPQQLVVAMKQLPRFVN
ncbi:hypothetical protein [Tateyamaria sp. Alg231-49]|uniref:hypothetical protein n=1 Tax=Tateyamaria sp. Alg231-49 TaxID=1922219 RepID=UPI000D5602C9|nr:hypothetical protein [Tateyamaria sp. Alg231-49]